MLTGVCKMKAVRDASYYKNKYGEDYEVFNGDLGCVWCIGIVALEDAPHHITDPDHISCKERGNYNC